MSAQSTAVALRVVEDHWNQKNVDLAAELFTPSCRIHTPDGELQHQEGAVMLLDLYATAFPDFHIKVDEIIAEKGKVAVQFTFNGTQTGALGSLPPSGNCVVVEAMAIFHVEGSKVCDAHLVWDKHALLQQVGAFVAKNGNFSVV